MRPEMVEGIVRAWIDRIDHVDTLVEWERALIERLRSLGHVPASVFAIHVAPSGTQGVVTVEIYRGGNGLMHRYIADVRDGAVSRFHLGPFA